MVPRAELDVHVETCPKRTFSCLHTHIGVPRCDFRGTVAEVIQHMRADGVEEAKSDADGKMVMSVRIPELGELRDNRVDWGQLWEPVPEHALFVHFVAMRARLFLGLFALSARHVSGYEMLLEHTASGTRLQTTVVFDSMERTKQCFPAVALGAATWDSVVDKGGTIVLSFWRQRSSKKRKFGAGGTGPLPAAASDTDVSMTS